MSTTPSAMGDSKPQYHLRRADTDWTDREIEKMIQRHEEMVNHYTKELNQRKAKRYER